jgi:hypothetical protein
MGHLSLNRSFFPRLGQDLFDAGDDLFLEQLIEDEDQHVTNKVFEFDQSGSALGLKISRPLSVHCFLPAAEGEADDPKALANKIEELQRHSREYLVHGLSWKKKYEMLVASNKKMTEDHAREIQIFYDMLAAVHKGGGGINSMT